MIRALGRDARGVTIVEFAFVLPALLTLLLAGFELGYRAYLGSVVQGALIDAARYASVGNVTETTLDAFVRRRIGVLTKESNVKSIAKESFYNYSNVGKPEKITSDTDPKGVYNKTDCFEDANNNGAYDTNYQTGLGTADDIVRYTVTVTYPSITPVKGWLGWGADQTITASTVLRNQPFTSRASPTIRCNV